MARIWRVRRSVSACFFGFLAINTFAAPPDLIINRARLAQSVEVQWRDFAADGCAVEEVCVRGPGTRKILLFEVAFANVGRGDLVIGAPEANPGLFDYSPCHDHYHLRGAATYALVTANGRTVLTGRKQAFCFRDNAPLLSWAGPSSGYDCSYMGITAGWEDIYDKSLDCQWMDITGVPPGSYLLRVTVNPRRLLREANYANNTTMVPVRIPRAGGAATTSSQPNVGIPGGLRRLFR